MNKSSEEGIQPYSVSYDLENCENEPIHFIRFVQSHAFLLVIDKTSLQILQATDNSQDFIGFSKDDLLKKNLQEVLPQSILQLLLDGCEKGNFDELNPISLPFQNAKEESLHMIIHEKNDQLILEIEPSHDYPSSANYFIKLENILQELQNTTNVSEMLNRLTEAVRSLTSYDRVMVYKFDEQWNGQVVAEAKSSEVEPYLHLRYPASDIPAQARALFLRNRIRIISDVHSTPAIIYPGLNPKTQQPLDLSDSVARGTSPIHIEYLINMGVQSTMSIAIVVNDQLWGLIACHHYRPLFIDFRIRKMIRFLGQIVSGRLMLQQSKDYQNDRLQSEKVRSSLMELMSANWDVKAVLREDTPNLLDLIQAEGVVLSLNGKLHSLGKVPAQAEINALIDRLSERQQIATTAVECVSEHQSFSDLALSETTGFLSVGISTAPYECIIWYRPELETEVFWGGNPKKAVVKTKQGIRLSPRKSFEKWKQVVRGRCKPWKKYESELAQTLVGDIRKVVIQKFNELRKLNSDLKLAFDELEAFSYTVSHDLRAPLRGIEGFVEILQEDYHENLDDYGQQVINTIVDSVGKMNSFIDDILSISRVRKSAMIINTLSIANIVTDIWKKRSSIEEKDRDIQLVLHEPLPELVGDHVMISQLFDNLISNAIKYSNESNPAIIEIGGKEEESLITFYVKDNGIGFEEKYADQIFDLFNRLVPEEDYAGTGVGLAIVKKVVQRHHGTIEVKSEIGKGSTFFISLPRFVVDDSLE